MPSRELTAPHPTPQTPLQIILINKHIFVPESMHLAAFSARPGIKVQVVPLNLNMNSQEVAFQFSQSKLSSDACILLPCFQLAVGECYHRRFATGRYTIMYNHTVLSYRKDVVLFGSQYYHNQIYSVNAAGCHLPKT